VEFRCHVGHVFTLDGMLSMQAQELETALWAAVRSLQESETLAHRASRRGDPQMSARFLEKAESMKRHADVIRKVLLGGQTLTELDGSDSEARAAPRGSPLLDPDPKPSK